jgi:asparagine synthase (glutamine-hydrolysing)
MLRVKHRPLLSQLLYVDAKTYLQELLMKQDQMSMAASVESRVPFLDHPLAEWVTGLPDSVKLRGTTTKWLLREAMRGDLPDKILRRPKMGFPVPIGAWLRAGWQHVAKEFILSERATKRDVFDPAEVRRLVVEHESGLNHSERLWALINFEIWARIYLDGEPPSEVSISAVAQQ